MNLPRAAPPTPDSDRAVGRARRAVARRPLEPLPVRHEPRLVRAVAARDARTRRGRARLLPAGRRRPARDGRQLDLLLRAAGGSVQPAHHRRASRSWLDAVRPRQRRAFDERGFAYFIREVYDSFYPGYGESWPMFQGADRHDLRAGLARAASRSTRDDGTMLTYQRRRPAPLHRGHHDR